MSKSRFYVHNYDRLRPIYNTNPNCYWCEQPTRLVERGRTKPLDNDHATFDHIYGKGNPLRQVERFKNQGVLACYKCNQFRGRKNELHKQPLWFIILTRSRIKFPRFIWKRISRYAR